MLIMSYDLTSLRLTFLSLFYRQKNIKAIRALSALEELSEDDILFDFDKEVLYLFLMSENGLLDEYAFSFSEVGL